MSTARERIADALARAYDGRPLADLRDEHATLHLEAADAVLVALAVTAGSPEGDTPA